MGLIVLGITYSAIIQSMMDNNGLLERLDLMDDFCLYYVYLLGARKY